MKSPTTINQVWKIWHDNLKEWIRGLEDALGKGGLLT